MLLDLICFYDGNAHVYYFDLPFEETVERHNTRPLAEAFGEDSLRSWWRTKDYLGIKGEKALTEDMTQNGIVELIYNQLETSFS